MLGARNDEYNHFPNAASSADVICTPLSITFPRIYRAALRDQVHYTLSPDRSTYPDLVEMKQVRSIVAGDRYSVVVRQHQSFDMAHAYLIGLKDGNQSERYDTICQTDQGPQCIIGTQISGRPVSGAHCQFLKATGMAIAQREIIPYIPADRQDQS